MKQPLPEQLKSKIGPLADSHAFVVPYDGTNNFYNDDRLKSFLAGAEALYNLLLSNPSLLPGHGWVKAEDMPEDEKSASWEQRNETYNICVTTPAGYSHVSCGYMKDEVWHWLESNKPVSIDFIVTHYQSLPSNPGVNPHPQCLQILK